MASTGVSAGARTVVVTGTASGIGAAVRADALAAGDRVIGIDRAPVGGAVQVSADLSTASGRSAAVAEALRLAGGVVDAVVTCAGLSGVEPVLPAVNFFGSTAVVEGLRDALAAAPAPRVVLVGSISGTQPVDVELVSALLAGDEAAAEAATRAALDQGRPRQLYPSSKSALAQWARRTAVAPGWAEAGIAINVVAPGVVLTPMSAGLIQDPAMKAVMDSAVPMPLHGYSAAADIARVIGFLASASTTHVTGQVLYVDGGAETMLRGPGVF